MTETKPSEGWGQIRPGDRVAHFYRGTFSLCGRVGFYSGPLDTDVEATGPDDCKTCRKKLGVKR